MVKKKTHSRRVAQGALAFCGGGAPNDLNMRPQAMIQDPSNWRSPWSACGAKSRAQFQRYRAASTAWGCRAEGLTFFSPENLRFETFATLAANSQTRNSQSFQKLTNSQTRFKLTPWSQSPCHSWEKIQSDPIPNRSQYESKILPLTYAHTSQRHITEQDIFPNTPALSF